MSVGTRMLALVAVSLLPVSPLRAATAADASGHWEGAIQIPSGDVRVALDLGLNDEGKLTGTFSNPAERLAGFPLWNVTADGRAVRVEIKTAGSGVQTFAGTLSVDGKAMSGDFLVSVYGVPFSLTRTGEARIEAAPHSPAVDAALVGVWSGSLDVQGKPLPVALTLTNHADGTATGNLAADGVAIPITFAHEGRSLTLASKVAPATYSGTVSPAGTEISGTFREGALEQPLTFRRTAGAR